MLVKKKQQNKQTKKKSFQEVIITYPKGPFLPSVVVYPFWETHVVIKSTFYTSFVVVICFDAS